jgi:hypothetical protein
LNWLILCSSSASSRFSDHCGTEPKASIENARKRDERRHSERRMTKIRSSRASP